MVDCTTQPETGHNYNKPLAIRTKNRPK